MNARGRPPAIGDARLERLELRLHADERGVIELAARAAGLSVGEWVRAVALIGAGENRLMAQLGQVLARPDPLPRSFLTPRGLRMPTLAEQQVSPPSSWEEFENIVRDAIRLRFDLLEVSRHGRSGQRQDGVDLYAQDEKGRWLGVQCRLTEVSAKDIQEETVKADAFKPTLSEYFVVTHMPRDVALQERVRLFSEERRASGKFRVHILFWPDVTQSLATNPRVFYKHFPQSAPQEEAPQRFHGLTFEELAQQLAAAPVQCTQYLGNETSNLFVELCRHLNNLEQQTAMMPILNAGPLWHFIYEHVAKPLSTFGLTEEYRPFGGQMAMLTAPYYRLTTVGRQFVLRLRTEISKIKVPDPATPEPTKP